MNALYKEYKKTFSKIEKHLTHHDLVKFMKCDYNRLFLYHFGLGTWIRNDLLQKNQKIYRLFIKAGVFHPDDMSSILTDQFYLYLRTK